MTVDEAIARLKRIAREHGGQTEVFFDCPNCDLPFAPNSIEKKAIHLKADPPKEPQK